MFSTHHRAPLVIGIALGAVVAVGSAATATHRSASPATMGARAPSAVTVAAVAAWRPLATTHHHRLRPAPRRAHHTAPAPRVTSPVAHRHRRPHRHATATTGPTGWNALDAAIARIPTYPAGQSTWVVSNKYGYWGTADWYHDTLYVAPGVPTDKLYDVAVHEWSHELSVLDYAGDVDAAVRAMNATFGGSGLTGAERAADCMAILQGATWTHYTTCQNSAWRQAAAKLVAGQRL